MIRSRGQARTAARCYARSVTCQLRPAALLRRPYEASSSPPPPPPAGGCESGKKTKQSGTAVAVGGVAHSHACGAQDDKRRGA